MLLTVITLVPFYSWVSWFRGKWLFIGYMASSHQRLPGSQDYDWLSLVKCNQYKNRPQSHNLQVVFPILAIVTSLSNCLALQQFLCSILIWLTIIYFMILYLFEILYLNCRLRVFSALNLLLYLPRCLDYYSVHTGDRMFVDNSVWEGKCILFRHMKQRLLISPTFV